MRRRARRRGFHCFLPAAAMIVMSAPAQSPSGAAPAAKSVSQNSSVDPAVCSRCHEGIAATFAKTGMGRSFSRATSQNLAEAVKSGPYFHEASHTYFETIERAGKFYQRRWQIGFDGRDSSV